MNESHPSSLILHPTGSERNIVVHLIEGTPAFLRRGSSAGGGPGGGGLARLACHGLATCALTPAEHPHFARNDLRRVALLAFLVLPLAGLQAALDVDLAAFLEILARDLRQAAEESHAMPFGAF